MCDMWVAVTCEYNGEKFSHRAEFDDDFDDGYPSAAPLGQYDELLDDAGNRVRAALREWWRSESRGK